MAHSGNYTKVRYAVKNQSTRLQRINVHSLTETIRKFPDISISYGNTKEMLADIHTKRFPEPHKWFDALTTNNVLLPDLFWESETAEVYRAGYKAVMSKQRSQQYQWQIF